MNEPVSYFFSLVLVLDYYNFFLALGFFYLGHIFCTTLKSWSMNYLLVEKGL